MLPIYKLLKKFLLSRMLPTHKHNPSWTWCFPFTSYLILSRALIMIIRETKPLAFASSVGSLLSHAFFRQSCFVFVRFRCRLLALHVAIISCLRRRSSRSLGWYGQVDHGHVLWRDDSIIVCLTMLSLPPTFVATNWKCITWIVFRIRPSVLSDSSFRLGKTYYRH